MFGIPLHANDIMKRKTNDILIFLTEILLYQKAFLTSINFYSIMRQITFHNGFQRIIYVFFLSRQENEQLL